MPLKQKIGIFIWFFLLILILLYHFFAWMKLIICLGLPLLVMGLGPIFYTKISLSKEYWFIPICISVSIGAIFLEFPNKSIITDNLLFILFLTFGVPIIFLLLRFQDCYQTIKIAKIIEPLNNLDLTRRLCQSIWLVIGEEILFRALFFQTLNSKEHVAYILMLNMIIFVYYHYYNRFASSIYRLKDYIFQGLLALNLGIIYLFTDSLLLCVLSHLTYNSINILSLILRSQICHKFYSKEGYNG